MQILLFKIDVTPLMKSKVCNESINREENKLHDYCPVRLALDLEKKIVLSYPYSVCGCYDG